MKNVAIFLFNEVEVLDFAGPFEVFSITGLRNGGERPFNVFTVAESSPVTARNNLIVTPAYLLNQHPEPDILLIPGGGGYYADGTPFGSRREMNNPVVLDWIRRYADKAELVLSVCTGALILARTGLLDNQSATTHFMAMDALQQVSPTTTIRPTDRYVDNGRIITSAGVSAGIDMSLYVVSRLLGPDAADETARYMQYDYWKPV